MLLYTNENSFYKPCLKGYLSVGTQYGMLLIYELSERQY